VGEQCDVGWMWGGSNATAGCDPVTCTFRAGFSCVQPGVGDTPDVPGPVRIPGPDGTYLVGRGWGEVPQHSALNCWCTAPPGFFANTTTGCVATACPFPRRCIEAPFAPGNGTHCVEGSEGDACIKCSKRWYRLAGDCRPCPEGVSPAVILLGIGVGFFFLYVGPKLSQLASPQAIALLRGLVMYLQYLSLSFDIQMAWPKELLEAFNWLKTLTSACRGAGALFVVLLPRAVAPPAPLRAPPSNHVPNRRGCSPARCVSPTNTRRGMTPSLAGLCMRTASAC
jgi:hypothetical protein